MKAKQDKRLPEAATEAESAQRRRIGRVVRDDRDGASVEWVEAPDDYQRVPLSIESTLPPNGIKPASGYDPYETMTPHRAAAKAAPDKRPAKRDLRRLSDWIKQMRELEVRKKRGED
ncbi:MAG TPA: hypothetical protein VMF03_19245 [Steroidobacteraceae bacterium]|nr:hypothetical protein [Steroidobacteraceae bacterium]